MLILIIFALILPFIYIKKPVRAKNLAAYDVIIVLGHLPNADGEMSTIMKSRILKAIELYHLNQRPMILCGGSHFDRPEEAKLMAKEALKNGVLREDILLDDKSMNTYANIKNAKRIMDEHSFKKAIIVSSSSHAYLSARFAFEFAIDNAIVNANRPEDFTFFQVILAYLYMYIHTYKNLFYRLSHPHQR